LTIGNEKITMGGMDEAGILNKQISTAGFDFFRMPYVIIRSVQVNKQAVIEMLLVVIIYMEIILFFIA